VSREIDERVAREVMGSCWHKWETVNDMDGNWISTCDRCGRERSGSYGDLRPRDGLPNFRPSTDIAATVEIVERFSAIEEDDRSYSWKIESCEASLYADPPSSGKWLVTLIRYYAKPYISDCFYGSAKDLPLAICLAALEAVKDD
jgi:hypothetical protein